MYYKMTDNNIINGVDLMNISPQNQPDDDKLVLCTICQEYIDLEAEIYNPTSHVLETCTHRFHTTCIINWFRQGNNDCPNCGDCGPAKFSMGAFSRRWYTCNSGKAVQRFNMLRNYSRTKKAPDFLVKQFEKLKAAKEKEKEATANYVNFKKNALCCEGESFKDLKKKVSKLRTDKYRKEVIVSNIKKTICGIPIIPVIIPKVKYVIKEVDQIPCENQEI